ncbi:hypothetical protein [Novipirellula artificiosorum]|uniref:Uncharacterized protein n=1 Tax=Novipirellula artificiosorum TaxID=2528016 RepID=A0A5C6DZE0_9BACT|nr:hypothetical protein [Novipirellula artificiosorum]TWU40436.1 hypothetical protein Poly41_12690 [Novipirellula artificiosorum]
MKYMIAAVVLVAASLAAFHYGGCYLLGGIEAGMPNGGAGKFKEYHKDNLFTEYLQGDKPDDFHGGGVTSNPFTE